MKRSIKKAGRELGAVLKKWTSRRELEGGKDAAGKKAWVIGLGRTGTHSYCEALRILGYRKVIHNPSFEELAEIDAAADNGCTIFYKYLDYKYPNSKCILSLRDLDPWLESAKYIHDNSPLSREDDVPIQRRMLLYETVEFDRDKFIEAYHRHHADVRRYFKDRPDDLLEMNIADGDGWEKLCPFLGIPVPQVPFPHRYKRNERAPSRTGGA